MAAIPPIEGRVVEIRPAAGDPYFRSVLVLEPKADQWWRCDANQEIWSRVDADQLAASFNAGDIVSVWAWPRQDLGMEAWEAEGFRQIRKIEGPTDAP